jgi:hypothetical protein
MLKPSAMCLCVQPTQENSLNVLLILATLLNDIPVQNTSNWHLPHISRTLYFPNSRICSRNISSMKLKSWKCSGSRIIAFRSHSYSSVVIFSSCCRECWLKIWIWSRILDRNFEWELPSWRKDFNGFVQSHPANSLVVLRNGPLSLPLQLNAVVLACYSTLKNRCNEYSVVEELNDSPLQLPHGQGSAPRKHMLWFVFETSVVRTLFFSYVRVLPWTGMCDGSTVPLNICILRSWQRSTALNSSV